MDRADGAAVITSVALERFGLVGFEEHPIDVRRPAGAAMTDGGLGFGDLS